MIGDTALANTRLAANPSQFLVTEAKLFSRLSPGVTNARYFDQAARNVACIAEVLFESGRSPEQFSSLGFLVLAPQEQIALNVFRSAVSKQSIEEKVHRRVSAYTASDRDKKDQWLRDWFLPTLRRINIECLSWEDIIKSIRRHDSSGFGEELSAFYGDCLRFNGIQEPG